MCVRCYKANSRQHQEGESYGEGKQDLMKKGRFHEIKPFPLGKADLGRCFYKRFFYFNQNYD